MNGTVGAERERGQTFSSFLQRYGIIIAFFILCVIVSSLSHYFLTPSNILNVVRQTSINGILALGMTMVVLTARHRSFSRVRSRSLRDSDGKSGDWNSCAKPLDCRRCRTWCRGGLRSCERAASGEVSHTPVRCHSWHAEHWSRSHAHLQWRHAGRGLEQDILMDWPR